MQEKEKANAFLFGPFVGELFWEMYRFAPYLIYIKKQYPDFKTVVLTRDTRFDLYGKYADFLVPLKLLGDESKKQDCFGLVGLKNLDFKTILTMFYNHYKSKFFIKGHFYPDIDWRYKVKWQFPRNQMCYEFCPRNKNRNITNLVINGKDPLVLIDYDSTASCDINYNTITTTTFFDTIVDKLDKRSSFLGCLIYLIKNIKFVVGNMNSSVCRLSLLLKTPVISVNESISEDSIKLINPFNTPVIKCENLEEGVKIYENNI